MKPHNSQTIFPNTTPQVMIIMEFTMHWPTRNGGGVVTGVSPLLNYHKEAKNLLKLKSNYSWKQNITTIKALSSVNSKMSAASIWYLSLYLCRSFPIHVTRGGALLEDFRSSDKFDNSFGNQWQQWTVVRPCVRGLLPGVMYSASTSWTLSLYNIVLFLLSEFYNHLTKIKAVSIDLQYSIIILLYCFSHHTI